MHDSAAAAFPSSDALLWRYAQAGDEAAFAQLVRLHGPMVGGICFRVLGEKADAEEVCQSTFSLLARKAGGLRERDEAGIARWLAVVALRLSQNRRRVVARRRRYEAAHAVEIVEMDAKTGLFDPGKMVREGIDEAVESLPKDMRDAIVARYYRGLGHEDAARELGTTPDAVRGRLHRALKLLRQRLDRRGIVATGTGITAALAGTRQALAFDLAMRPAKLPWVPAALVPAALSLGWRGAVLGIAAVFAVVLGTLGGLGIDAGAVGQAESGDASVRHVPAEPAPPERQRETPERGAAFLEALADLGFSPSRERRVVLDEDNGYDDLERMAAAWREISESDHELYRKFKAVNGGEWDPEFAAAVLAVSAEPLAYYGAVLAAPDLQFPEYRFLDNLLHVGGTQMANVELKSLEAEAALRAGDQAAGIVVLLEMHELGHRFEEAEGILLHYLVGTTIRAVAATQLARHLDEGRLVLTPSDLAALASAFASSAPRRETVELAVNLERAAEAELVGNVLDRDADAAGRIVNWGLGTNQPTPPTERVLRAFARIDPATLAAEFALRWEREDAHFAGSPGAGSSPPEIDASAIAGLTGDALAVALVGRLGAERDLSRMADQIAESAARHRLTETRIAVLRAVADGRGVTTLADLVPTYLTAIPLDPFNGSPLRFDTERGIAWSVGRDQADAGGQTREDRPGSLRDDQEIVMRLR